MRGGLYKRGGLPTYMMLGGRLYSGKGFALNGFLMLMSGLTNNIYYYHYCF